MNKINKISIILFAALVICCAGFVLLRSQVVLNRYTDSWWHIAVADEYVKTGVFAKDPFIEDAPEKFAQFGLMDLCNAWIVGANVGAEDFPPVRDVFIWCVAGNVVLFLVGAFMAGFWINRSAWQGLVSAVVWMLLYPGNTIINLGFPFAVSAALLGFLFVSFWVGAENIPPVHGFIWRGLLLGIIFDMHVFVGAVGCVMAAVWVVVNAGASGRSPVRRQFIWKIIIFGISFLLVAWRWIVMHINLRGALAVSNAHMRDSLPLDKEMLIIVLAAMVILLVKRVGAENIPPVHVGGKNILSIPPVRIINSMLIYGVILLVLSLPPLNNIIMRHTSWYMAHRILWLFPIGVIFAFIMGEKYSARTGAGYFARMAWKYIIIFITLVALLPAVKVWGMKQLFLARTDEYDVHDFGYLEKLKEFNFIGKTVLADPVTSYYLRGMAGAYVCTVIPGEGSPALDYVSLNEKVRGELIAGDSSDNIDIVVLDIKNGATEHFLGEPIKDIVGLWVNNGWEILLKNNDMIVMCCRGRKISARTDGKI